MATLRPAGIMPGSGGGLPASESLVAAPVGPPTIIRDQAARLQV